MPPTTGTIAPTIDQYAKDIESFLAARYPKKSVTEVDTPFTWGEGDDALNLFEDVDLDEQAENMKRVREYRNALYEAGYAWIDGPEEYGGAGANREYAATFERIVRNYAVPTDSVLTVSLGMIVPTMMTWATEPQRARWIPALQRGDLVCCQLFSEPEAGSDLASIRTKAVRDGDGWRVTGQKVWTSGAHLSDIGEIICRTTDEPRYQNLTAFIVDMHAPGVEVRPLRQMSGSSSFNEVFLDDVYIPDTDRLAEIGDGWKVALTTLGNERSAIGHSAFGGHGLLKLDRVIGLLRHTGADKDPVARQRFADLVIQIRVAKYNQERLLARIKSGTAPGPEMSMTKLALARNLTQLAEFGAAIAGPKATADTGEWGMYSWANMLLSAPGYHIGGGTDEIMQNILAERVLGLPR